MVSAVFRDKIGRVETLDLPEGQKIRDALVMLGIPTNAVLTFINGEVVSEEVAIIKPDDTIEFLQVRHYNLDVTRQPPRRIFTTSDPIYSKSVMFDDLGSIQIQSEQFSKEDFISYVEKTFVESIELKSLFCANDRLVIGLSGGRDSVALLKLLQRTHDLLPRLKIIAVTVTGLPDWEESTTFETAQTICKALEIEQVIVTEEEINQTFHLPRAFRKIMQDILSGSTESLVMVIIHHVLRRMVEIEAKRRGSTRIALGLNADDLVASLVTWFTSGFHMGGIPLRTIGPFEYIFPLFRITKKELTLYLELLAPELNRQGPPGHFTTGPDERSLAYAVADHLFDLWPGIDYYLFKAFESTQHTFLPKEEKTCTICGGIFLEQPGFIHDSSLCDVCEIFSRRKL